MARKYRVVAEVEEDQGPPVVGEKISDWDFSMAGKWNGTITEVTPIMTAEDALEEIRDTIDQNNHRITRPISAILADYYGSAGPQ